jgi:hypothetical protein
MTLKLRALTPFAVAMMVAIATACSTEESTGDGADEVVAADGLFGDDTSMFQDDRIGRRLKGDLGKVPSDLPGLESLFGVGRNCKRKDGKKEIFIVEEKPREPELAGVLLPRAVITGCNTDDPSQAATIKNSFSLMMGVNPDPNAARSGDAMMKTPMETMAYDDRTGLFNFYVFSPTGPGKPGTVTRFWRAKDGTVMSRSLAGGTTTPTNPAPFQHNACFRCHVDGAPIMNELSEPWTNWVSPKKRLSTDKMTGLTKELVANASLADQFEGIIRSATQLYVEGKKDPNAAQGVGWLARVRGGLLPGGVARLVRPLFCESDLNYRSSDSTLGVPEQVYFDPSVSSAAGLPIPDPPKSNVPVPFLFPIRSVFDETVQSSLVDAGFVAFDVAVAIRLLDDENDVFSPQRCGVFDDVSKELAKLGAQPQAANVASTIKRVVDSKLSSLKITPARLAYIRVRLAEGDHEAAQQAYNAELQKRFAAMDMKIEPREAKRKDLAHKKFPGDASNSPLPQLDPPE